MPATHYDSATVQPSAFPFCAHIVCPHIHPLSSHVHYPLPVDLVDSPLCPSPSHTAHSHVTCYCSLGFVPVPSHTLITLSCLTTHIWTHAVCPAHCFPHALPHGAAWLPAFLPPCRMPSCCSSVVPSCATLPACYLPSYYSDMFCLPVWFCSSMPLFCSAFWLIT